MKKPFYTCFLILSTGLLLLSGCSRDQDTDPSIAALTVATADFQLLEDAAVAGGVVETLSNKNPNDSSGKFTVFAPTNAAFARLGLRTAADLTGLQTSFLTSTLLYHVANGTIAGSALTGGTSFGSALGVHRRIIARNGSRYVNGSQILATDVKAANGTVHVLDKVLLATGVDIVESAVALKDAQVFTKPELSFLVEAVLYADLAGALKGPGPFTVFAPTDQAFRDLGTLLQVPLNVPADIRRLPKATVTAVLLNHVVPGARFTPELPENTTVTPLGGTALSLGSFAQGMLPVQGKSNPAPARMVIPDVQCTNGIVHIIDRVLLP
ncbi:fasciclin domain-containing protein [Hymenobacter glacieicola]|uniref:Beta-Ig-H3/fasciclin domain-containing protein n=1 Tax=Hymenobacter glacieicola TaxID=1562124 RepID=A0ABQ1WLK9_9BACT|nr:fasciclin domain-containing protein [Hymenobacter glacieicola]GGG35868.1 beta-Ig-H3/fasciclin domain-containing protein [Hymenobacter glacieicola]